MIPLTPCSITSGTAPCRVAITGVPQAIDSIITRPKGSSPSIGKRVARASCSRAPPPPRGEGGAPAAPAPPPPPPGKPPRGPPPPRGTGGAARQPRQSPVPP